MPLAHRQRPGLVRDGGPSSCWEVDYSGLAVRGVRAGGWIVEPYLLTMGSPSQLQAYLCRHGLQDTRFASRARAVDALRLALLEEPLSRARPRVKWRRESEGVYLSSDGHWRLSRGREEGQLSPLSPEAQQAVEQCREVKRTLRRARRWTLPCWAEWTDRINQHLGLGRPAGQVDQEGGEE